MERGVKVLVRILAGAMLLGALVTGFHPGYRATLQAMLRGGLEESPIWQSNANYYIDVHLEGE